MDGSCFFHAIFLGYYRPYQIGYEGGRLLDRKKFVRNFRDELAKKLEEPVNPQDNNSKILYQTLSNGELESIGKEVPEYSLENLQETLRTGVAVDNAFMEIVSDVLDLDIYILDAKTKDVYPIGTSGELYHKGRRTVVLLYLPGHYELVGIKLNNSIQTLFSPNHDFIESIRERLRLLTYKS